MSSLAPGDNTLKAEVTNISQNGIWLLTTTGKELFLSYDDFPWFKDQPVKAIFNLEEPCPGHFHWPDIDVDLSEKIIEHPAQYPLIAKN